MGLFSIFERKLPLDTQKIEEAISHLETKTSAEVRVVVERKAKNVTSAIERAKALFEELDMYQTAERNGVLLYLAFKPHYIAVIGDEGIHQKVGAEFWQSIYDSMKTKCQQGEYTQAICDGIEQVEVVLAQHFPLSPNDSNELSNEVIIK
ncbi:TPM domain-containing protein [Glaesserella sp.]|uniref:TPM domain-containing protein n=1 Tax=Glaesserella sp. TaxID=2094731 RepID=UPI00359F8D95